MYGLIHACLQQMVKSRFGEDKWTSILSGTGLSSKSFLTFHCYSDEETLELINSAAQVLHISLESLLELFGEYFLTYVMDNGYEDMLRRMGSTFLDFIQNINYLHWYLMSTAYPGIVSPSFVCSTDPDDQQPPMLDYYSHRPGMHPVAIGLLRAVGREFFHTIVDFEFLGSKEERLSSKTKLYHRRFRVNTKPAATMMALSSPVKHFACRQSKDLNNRSGAGEKDNEMTRRSTEKSRGTDKHLAKNRMVPLSRERRSHSLTVRSKSRQPLGALSSQSTIESYNNVGVTRVDLEGIHVQGRNISIPSKLFCQMHPYHLVFDSASFVIVQAGNRLMQFYPNLSLSPKMDSVFELVWPMVPLTPYNLKKFKGFVFQLAVKSGEYEAKGNHNKVTEGKGSGLLSKRTTDRGKLIGTPQDIDDVGRDEGQWKGSASENLRYTPRANAVGNFGNHIEDDVHRRDAAVHRRDERKLHLPPVKDPPIPARATKAPHGQSMQRIRVAKQEKFESYKVTARGTELTRKGIFGSVVEEGRRRGGNKQERSKGREAKVEGIEVNRPSGGRKRNDEREDKPWKWKSPPEHKKSGMESKDGVKKKNRLVKKGDSTPADKTTEGNECPSAVIGLVLKGEIYRMEAEEGSNEDGLMIFVGTPLLNSLSDMQDKSMHLSDVPLHDSTRELVLLKHQRSTEFDLMSSLEETTSELRSTWQALQEEKQKADSLLYSMIPREVAHLLQSGERVQQSFSECTILFSDIVTFTVIASKSTPMQIVDMLNALYTEFDALTEINEVYKVETIGDAYMVVGGVPRESPNHARQVARQAVGMVNVSGRVLSPVSGQPIEIRVGIHSGPVVAGCVGLKMPRYCLFGDTVNTASRMESHGVPGKVHVSATTKRALESSEFKMVKRGDIDIKGKGVMDTYFLVLEQK